MSAVLPLYYLPPVSYFQVLYHSDSVLLEGYEHYQKQTLRNRCRIKAPDGVLSLTIPVEKMEGKTCMRDVRISGHGNWRRQHWNAFKSYYGQSPFFEYYEDDFAPFYERNWMFLAEYNEELLRLLCTLMDIPVRWQFTTSYQGLGPELHEPRTQRPYYQLFQNDKAFNPDLSVVDLLFNMGPESVLYL